MEGREGGEDSGGSERTPREFLDHDPSPFEQTLRSRALGIALRRTRLRLRLRLRLSNAGRRLSWFPFDSTLHVELLVTLADD